MRRIHGIIESLVGASGFTLLLPKNRKIVYYQHQKQTWSDHTRHQNSWCLILMKIDVSYFWLLINHWVQRLFVHNFRIELCTSIYFLKSNWFIQFFAVFNFRGFEFRRIKVGRNLLIIIIIVVLKHVLKTSGLFTSDTSLTFNTCCFPRKGGEN